MKSITPLLCLLMFCTAASAAPVIDSIYNNATDNNATHLVINYTDTVHFVVDANETITTWVWCADGVVTGGNADNITITYGTEQFYHNLTVNATNANGTSGEVEYRIWVHRNVTATPQPTCNESEFEQLDDSMQATNPDFTEFTEAIAAPYINRIGSIFFLFLFGLPLLMIYIRQDSIHIPATFLFLFGAFVLVLLPPQFVMIGTALLALALFGALYSYVKERER